MKTLLAAAAAAMLLAACQSAPQAPAEKAPDLAGTPVWMWAEGAGSDCELPPTISFKDGKVTGNSGCNGFMGGYTLEGTKLRFSQNLAATMKLCGSGFMRVEAAFLDALRKTAYAVQEGEVLILMDENREPLINLVPEAPGHCE